MEALSTSSYGSDMSNAPTTSHPHPTPRSGPSWRPDPDAVVRAVTRRSFATLATASATGRPHVAGILYRWHEGSLYVSTLRTSRKAVNIEARPEVAVTVPVRRLPVGPPSTVQFQGRAEVLASDGPEIGALVASGAIDAITGHGELDLPDGCFLRITPSRRLVTYGLGMSLWTLIRHPLEAGGVVELPTPRP